MRTRLHHLFLSFLFVAGWLYLLTIPIFVSHAQPHRLTDGIAAIVNSEVITISELENEFRDEAVRLRARYSGKELEKRLNQKEYDVLNRIIERKLQLQEARAKGISVSEEEVDEAFAEIRQSQPHIAESTPRSRVREELILRRMLDFEIRRRIMVSHAEVHSYYNQAQDEFTTPAQYHLRQILLKPQLGESITEVFARAKSLMEQIKQGADFSALAKQYSQGTESVLGGDLGFMRKDELLAPLANALKGLKVGDVCQPVETELGVHILLLEGTTPGKPLPFEEVQESIKGNLLQRKTRDTRSEWLSDLKDKAYIEIRF